MLRITGYIEKLLLQHDCVMIPSFGAIIKETLSPIYSSRERIVYPSSERFYYNPDLRDRDNLLDDLYAKNYGLSLRRARLMVDKDVDQLKSTLMIKKEVRLGKIGLFQVQENDSMIFLPTKKKNFLGEGDYYGILSYPLPSLGVSTEELGRKSERPGLSSDSDYWQLRINKKVGRVAVAVALLLMIAIPSSVKSVKNRYSAGFTATKITSSPPSNILDISTAYPLNRVSLVPFRDIKQNIAREDRLKETLETIEQPAVVAPNYFVVIGAFSTERKVQEYVKANDQLPFASTMGYVKQGSRFLIYAFSTDDREKADEFIQRLRAEQKDFRDAWLFHTK